MTDLSPPIHASHRRNLPRGRKAAVCRLPGSGRSIHSAAACPAPALEGTGQSGGRRKSEAVFAIINLLVEA